ncbi:hypothetical protein [Kistimonas asteriae]|uniref:hypothetical protein n=1 Tax=Kistimonas asteriae TaxID=517724 RepID=UPI001BA8D3C2|nr:hypothetical protein [Kistimonas asteriae]
MTTLNVNRAQSFRDNWSTLTPHEKMGLLTTLQNVELHTDELFAACEKGLSTKKPRKWKERLQRLLEQSHSLLDNITQLESDTSKDPAYRSDHEIRVQDIEKTKNSLTTLISQIEPLVQPSIAPTAKTEPSKKTDTEKPTHTLDDDLQQIEVILKKKEEELKTIKLTQTTAINIDEVLLETHRSPDEIHQLEQTFNRSITKKRGKFTERIGKIVHLLSCAYKIHVSQEYDMTELCQNHLHRLEIKAERNQTFSRLWFIYAHVEQLQSQFPQIMHHLSDIKELFTDDAFKNACKVAYDLTKEACKLKESEAEKLANILQITLETYTLIFEARINHDIERVIYLADLLHQTMKALENTTLHRSDWYLEIYQKHLSYIIDLPNYCEVCFHNNYINSDCDQTIFALENIAEKIGIEKLTDILNKTCNVLYKRGNILFTSHIIIWQLNKKIQHPGIKISLLENTQELYVKLTWDQTKHGTQFMVDHKEPCEFMLMQAETKLALGNAMKKFMIMKDDYSFWKDALTLESDQSNHEFWMQRFNQFQPDAHIAQIRDYLSTLSNQESELTKVFDFSESLINEELSAQSVHETLEKLSVEKTLTLLHDTYCKIKTTGLLQQKYRNPSLEAASVLVRHSEVLQGIGDQISPDYHTNHGQIKVHLHAAITAYKQALFMELFYYKIFKIHFSEQFTEFYKNTDIPQPNPSRVLSLWQALSRTLLELDRIGAGSSVEYCRFVEDTFRDYHEELFQLATKQPGFINENLDFLQHRVRCLCIAGHDQASLSTLNILLSVLPKHPDGVKSLERHSNPLPPGFLDRQFDQCRRYMRKLLQAVQEQPVNVLESAKALVEFTHEFTETLQAHDVLTKGSSCPVRLQAQTAAACSKELADTRNLCLEYQPYLAGLEEIQKNLQTAQLRTIKTFPTDIEDMTTNIQQFSVDDILNMLNYSLDNITVFETVFTRITNIKPQQPTHPLPLRIIQDNLLSLSQCTQDFHKNYTCLHEHLCQTYQYTEFKNDSGDHIVNLTGMIQRLGKLSLNIHNAIVKISEVTTDILLNHNMPLRECYYNITTFSNTAEWLKILLRMPSKTAKKTQYTLVIQPLKDHLKITRELIDKDTRLSKTSLQRKPRFLLNTIHIFTHQVPDLLIACDALSSYLTCFRRGKPFFDDERNCPTREELKDTCQSIMEIIKEKQRACSKKIPNSQEHSYQQTLHQIVTSFTSSIDMCDSLAKDMQLEHRNLFSRVIPVLALQNLRKFQEDLNRRLLHYKATLRAQVRVTHNRLFSEELAPDSTDN